MSGAMILGLVAPLGLNFIITDRLFDLGPNYSLVAGVSLILTAVLNPIGIAGADPETERTGLSERDVADRVRGLSERNIIGISAVLDWRAAGYQWNVFLSVSAGSGGAGAVIDELAHRDEVVSIYEVSGRSTSSRTRCSIATERPCSSSYRRPCHGSLE